MAYTPKALGQFGKLAHYKLSYRRAGRILGVLGLWTERDRSLWKHYGNVPKHSARPLRLERSSFVHEMGAADRDRLLEQRIAAMDADGFERLVFELAHREDPRVRRLKPPDGGADTLRPATADTPSKVWQAKHYPTTVAWKKCRESLEEGNREVGTVGSGLRFFTGSDREAGGGVHRGT